MNLHESTMLLRSRALRLFAGGVEFVIGALVGNVSAITNDRLVSRLGFQFVQYYYYIVAAPGGIGSPLLLRINFFLAIHTPFL